MKHFYVALVVVASMLVVACASQTNKGAGGSARPGKVTASGYTKEGCLLNLKLAARERNGRLVPDGIDVDANFLMLVFPFLNQDGYRCSGSYVERAKRSSGKDPLYPID